MSNRTGYFRCPLALLQSLPIQRNVNYSVIHFTEEGDEHSERLLDSLWYSLLNEQYNYQLSHVSVMLLDFYSDRTTLSKLGTQSTTIFRVRFSNL